MLGLKLIRDSKGGPWWYMYLSVHWAIMSSGNDLSFYRRQAITRMNADLFCIGPVGINPGKILINVKSSK